MYLSERLPNRAFAFFLMVSFSWFPGDGLAASDTEELREQLEALKNQVELLTQRLETTEKQAKSADEKAEKANQVAETASHEALAPDRAKSKWHLSGYMDAGFISSDEEGENFVSGHFNPAFHFDFNDYIFFEAELEFETEDDGATEMALEYAHADLMVHDYATVVIGKWLSPVGQFQERLHPSWINKLASAPIGFGHGGVQPLSDIGLQVRGGVPLNGTLFTYAVGVGNGPQGGHHGVELEGFNKDNNDNKAVSARVGFLPLPYFEIGASYMKSDVPGEEADTGPVTEGDFELWGVDAAFTKGAWDIRAEYLNSELGSFLGRRSHSDTTTSLIPETEWTAWYAQAAYRLSGLTNARLAANLEPVIRYGELDTDGFFAGGDDESRFDVGLNYWFSSSAVGKIVGARRDFDDPGREDENLLQIQFAYGF